ncbi:MAG: universal stress protein, partial [Lactobacillus sp.]
MADGQYHNILVPVDGSKVTAQVLEKGIAMAKACDAHLDILNVVQVTQLSDGYAPASSLSPDQTYDLVKTTQERLEDLKQKAIDAGVAKVDIHVRFGNP